jgi:hypothetical protein
MILRGFRTSHMEEHCFFDDSMQIFDQCPMIGL